MDDIDQSCPFRTSGNEVALPGEGSIRIMTLPHLLNYSQQQDRQFTRSRPMQKNDNARVTAGQSPSG